VPAFFIRISSCLISHILDTIIIILLKLLSPPLYTLSYKYIREHQNLRVYIKRILTIIYTQDGFISDTILEFETWLCVGAN
jgi:hypothetical protein